MREIEERLIEWGRWVRVRPQQGHCASIEHRYRRRIMEGYTPTGWGDWQITAPQDSAPRIDVLRALETERTMRHVPGRFRKALRLWYVLRLDAKKCSLRLHLPVNKWGELLGHAENMVVNIISLTQRKKSLSSLYQLSIPGKTDGAALVSAGAIYTEKPAY